MFTGIIEEVGRVVQGRGSSGGSKLTISARNLAAQVPIGGSIAVEGTCLTVTMKTSGQFVVDVMPVTATTTTLGSLSPGSLVNLERALPAGGRFDGHVVTGHVDCTGVISAIVSRGNALLVHVKVPDAFSHYLVAKGSIALDGISLTIVEASRRTFVVSIIPHTWAHTSLQRKHSGSRINLEFDILAKYVAQYENHRVLHAPSQKLTRELLQQHGFL